MSRIRRDPREELAAATVAFAPRLRIDRAHRGGARAVAAHAASEAAPRISIPEPDYLVFAVADAPGGILNRHDAQVLGAARVLAGGRAAVVLLAATASDAGASDAGALGADRQVSLPGGDGPEAAAARIAATIQRDAPRHVLFPETADGGDLARRIAAILEAPLFDSVEALTPTNVIRPASARRREWRAEPPLLLSIAPDMVPAYRGPAHEVEPVEAADAPFERGILRTEPVNVEAAAIPLGQASVVISAGNGVKDFRGFLDLARALGATPGASRVVCDAGLLPRALQVGASGTVLDADVYLAFGISGAPQHLQGIGKVEHVIAVNTDLHAAMIARAGLAIIADAQDIIPALRESLRS